MLTVITREILMINLCESSKLTDIEPRKGVSWVKTREVLEQLLRYLIKTMIKLRCDGVYSNIEGVHTEEMISSDIVSSTFS